MRRSGVTLVELLVVIAVLGVMCGVSGLALTSLRAPRESDWIRDGRAARARAIREGRPVELPTARPLERPTVLFLPDGRAIGSGVEPLTGTLTRATP